VQISWPITFPLTPARATRVRAVQDGGARFRTFFPRRAVSGSLETKLHDRRRLNKERLA
jgi:hypothetical protein